MPMVECNANDYMKLYGFPWIYTLLSVLNDQIALVFGTTNDISLKIVGISRSIIWDSTYSIISYN